MKVTGGLISVPETRLALRSWQVLSPLVRWMTWVCPSWAQPTKEQQFRPGLPTPLMVMVLHDPQAWLEHIPQ